VYDELGPLVPAHVDPDTGYHRYAATQLDPARLASLRRIGVPMAQISNMLALQPAAAAAEIRVYWAGTEAEHVAGRELVGHLVDRLHAKKSAMYEVAVGDVPARSLCSLMHRIVASRWPGARTAHVAGGDYRLVAPGSGLARAVVEAEV
jgi:protein phosphatase